MKIKDFLIYIIFILVYLYEKSLIFPENQEFSINSDLISVIVPVLIAVSSLLYLYFSGSKTKLSIISTFTILSVITYVITVFNSMFYPLLSRIIYVTALFPVLFFIIGYHCGKRSNNEQILVYIFLIAIGLSVYFLRNYKINYLVDNQSVIKSTYSILYLFPFFLCSKKNWIRLSGLLLTFFIVVVSFKRGGIIALALGISAYFIVYQQVSSGKKIHIWRIIIGLVIIFGLSIILIYINKSADNLVFNRFEGIDNDGGSGRLDIYESVLTLYDNSSFHEKIFGHGWFGVQRNYDEHLSAHNDFLEILYDFGLVSLLLYVAFIIQLIKILVKLMRRKSQYAPAMATSVAIFLVNSSVSHIYIYPWHLMLFTLFWGYIIMSDKNYCQLKTLNR